MNKRQHKHRIDVETDQELVTVTIGADGGVPGGFAKLFNRVVDSEAWSRLSDAARAVYVPLVRFADHRNQFRVQLGRAAMMKYTGLSQSSIKRAVKDLVAQRLVVLIEMGGVSASGENASNVYQLLVPAEARRAPSPAVSPTANPPGVQPRTPSRILPEPPPGLPMNREPVRGETRRGDQPNGGRGFANGPQLRMIDKENSKTGAAVLLEDKGVERAAARQLAEAYPYERIVDVVAAMEWRKARGKCDNPGGFIREALIKQWQTPRAVIDARARAEARLRAEELARQAKVSGQREAARADQDEARIDRLIDSLDDDDLATLADSVVEKYRGNGAVIGVLTRKPPRECRLMKMEIAAMLGTSPAG